MERIEITEAPLFENLLSFPSASGTEIDLHGDYVCSRFTLTSGTLSFEFRPSKSQDGLPAAKLVFSEAAVDGLALSDDAGSDDMRLETLERVRLQHGDELVERWSDGRVFFLIELLPDLVLEFRARSGELLLSPSGD